MCVCIHVYVYIRVCDITKVKCIPLCLYPSNSSDSSVSIHHRFGSKFIPVRPRSKTWQLAVRHVQRNNRVSTFKHKEEKRTDWWKESVVLVRFSQGHVSQTTTTLCYITHSPSRWNPKPFSGSKSKVEDTWQSFNEGENLGVKVVGILPLLLFLWKTGNPPRVPTEYGVFPFLTNTPKSQDQ